MIKMADEGKSQSGLLSPVYEAEKDPGSDLGTATVKHSASTLASSIAPLSDWASLASNLSMSHIFDTDTNNLTGNATLDQLSSGMFDSNNNLTTTTEPGDVTEDIPIFTETIPYATSVILIILYSLTTVAAVSGNSLAIMVFTRGKRSNTDLRPFLINLAAADLIMAIFCIPFTFAYQITGNWMFSEVMCPIVQCCQVVSVTASVSTNTAIGIDRLVAVKFPFRKRVTSSYTRLVILGIWVFAGGLGAVPLMKGRTREMGGKLQCEEEWSSQEHAVIYGFFIMIITYFLPVTILSGTYTIIGRHLWRHKVPGNADDQRDALQLKAKRKVVKMLVTIVLLFGVCWLPLHSFIIIITFNKTAFGTAANMVYFAVHWLSMANSFVNPVVYGFMNENFRADLESLMCSCCCLGQHCGRQRLKYRAAAVKRRLGDGHVHDAASYSLTRLHGTGGKRDNANGDWKVNGKAKTTVSQGGKAYNSLDVPKANVARAGKGKKEFGWSSSENVLHSNSEMKDSGVTFLSDFSSSVVDENECHYQGRGNQQSFPTVSFGNEEHGRNNKMAVCHGGDTAEFTENLLAKLPQKTTEHVS